MSEREQDSTAHRSWWPHPLLVAALSCQFFVISLAVVTALALWAGKEGLRAQPPKITWQFAVIFFGGMAVATALHFYVLYTIKDRDFWPRGGKAWLKATGPFFIMLATFLVPAAMQRIDVATMLAMAAMGAAMIIGLLPTLLCLADFTRSFSQQSEETVGLYPVSLADLPGNVRAYFEHHTPDLLQLGFQPLGDYRLKQRSSSFARFFLNAERDAFAEITCHRLYFASIRAVCFFSLTPDGNYLESSNMRLSGKRPQIKNFELQGLPGLSGYDVYELHRSRLRELDGGTPRLLRAEQLEPLIRYGNKRLYELLIAEGRARKNPYADFDDALLLADGKHPWESDLQPSLSTWDSGTPLTPAS